MEVESICRSTGITDDLAPVHQLFLVVLMLVGRPGASEPGRRPRRARTPTPLSEAEGARIVG
jgi:hypothetical protein